MKYWYKLIYLLLPVIFLISNCNKVTQPADLIILNANIITMDENIHRGEAFAVKKGYFQLVGKNSQVLKLKGKQTIIMDVAGNTIIPGIIDSHMHPDPTYDFESPYHIVNLSPDVVETMDDLIDVLSRKARITPEGEWIRGTLYQDTKLGRHPNRFDLDGVSASHPIMLTHSSHHVFVVNTYALTRAGLLDVIDDPPGGAFDRTKDGLPNGVLREPPALNLVLDSNRAFAVPDGGDELQAYFNTFQRFLEKGITGIGDAALEPDKFSLYSELVNRGLPVRIYNMFGTDYLEHLIQLGIKTGFGNDRLKVGSVKVFHGNSLSGQKCWLSESYEGRPGYYGIPPGRSQEELNELVLAIHRSGLQAAIHANGDREMVMVLDAIEYALQHHPKEDHRHRIEHASVVTQAILERVKELNVILAPHSYIYEHGDKMVAYGEWRWPWMHPNRKALDLGIPVTGNSDYPVSAADPMLRIQSLVTRTSAEGVVFGPDETLTPEQAIYTFTMGSAFAQFEEESKGSITKGKFADFVILSDNPLTADPFKIKDILVLQTFINGEEVYRNDSIATP